MMKAAKAVSLIGLLAMGGAIIYAVAVGDFGAEGSQIVSLPWGIVSLVDLYVGFSLFAMWIIYREGAWQTAVFWVALLMVLGFFIGALYVLLALHRSDGDWDLFWHGRSREHQA